MCFLISATGMGTVLGVVMVTLISFVFIVRCSILESRLKETQKKVESVEIDNHLAVSLNNYYNTFCTDYRIHKYKAKKVDGNVQVVAYWETINNGTMEFVIRQFCDEDKEYNMRCAQELIDALKEAY